MLLEFLLSQSFFIHDFIFRFEVSYEALTWYKFVDKARQAIRCDLSDDNTKGFFFDTLIKQTNLDESK